MCVCTPFFFPLSRMVAYDSKPYLISYRRSWRPTMPPISQFGVVDSIDLSRFGLSSASEWVVWKSVYSENILAPLDCARLRVEP